MTEPSQEASNRELLQKLAALEAKVAWLENHLGRMTRNCKTLSEQVGGLLNQVGMMDLQVIELAEKVFPGYIRTQRQIMEICRPPTKGNGKEKDPPG